MGTIYADLHVHSTASDGIETPTQVVERARAAKLHVFALTDHDTVAGIDEAQKAAAARNVEFIAGAEMTCYADGREVHVLAYGIDHRNDELLEYCEMFRRARLQRAADISKRLAEAGVPIDMHAVVATADGGNVGRAHIARALIAAGHVKDNDEAFSKYLGEGCCANVAKPNTSPEEVVGLIRRCGGMAIMAHPGVGNQFDLIPRLIAAGCRGIEVWHSAHDTATTERLFVYALERGLVKTGGSDCHGTPSLIGGWGIDRAQWNTMIEALGGRTTWRRPV